jgi:PPP family 3-phenylpropionic acid transporter
MALKVPYVRLSGFYFFHFALLGGLLPYWPLYLQNAGYDPLEIGWIMAILPATRIVSPGLWGWLADRGGRTLSLIRWAAFLALLAVGGMFGADGFFRLAAVMATFSFFWSATLPLFETVTLGHLRRTTSRYSQIRLWGSIGFIITVWAVGESLDGPLAIACLPQLLALLSAGLWLVTLMVPPVAVPHPDEGHGSLAAILRRGEVLAFFLVSVLLQMAHGPYYVFFSVYLESHGFSGGETGKLWALGVLAEIVLFAGLHRIFDRTGLRGVFLASIALSVVRWLLIAWGIRHFLLILLAQILHAASFGSVHAASIQLVHRYFRGPHHGKGQALYSSLSFGLGGALGSLFAGQFWSAWGPQGIYTGAAGFSLVALAVAWAGVGSRETR